MVFLAKLRKKENLPLAAILALLCSTIAFIILSTIWSQVLILVGIFQATGLLVLVVVTAIYAVETNKMASEMEKTRAFENEPKIAISIKQSVSRNGKPTGIAFPSIQNIGRGTAFSLKVSFQIEKQNLVWHTEILKSGETFTGHFFDELEPKLRDKFHFSAAKTVFKVNYQNSFGKLLEFPIELDKPNIFPIPYKYGGFGRDDILKDISRTLNDIERKMP